MDDLVLAALLRVIYDPGTEEQQRARVESFKRNNLPDVVERVAAWGRQRKRG